MQYKNDEVKEAIQVLIEKHEAEEDQAHKVLVNDKGRIHVFSL